MNNRQTESLLMNLGGFTDALVLNANKRIVGVVTARNHRSRYEIGCGCEEKQPAEESTSNPVFIVAIHSFACRARIVFNFMQLFRSQVNAILGDRINEH